MSRLIESVLVFNGQIINWSFHLERMRNSMMQHFGCLPFFNFENIFLVASQQTGKVKLKIIYDNRTFNFTFENYTTSKITSLKLIHNNRIDYSLKYKNRSPLDNLFSKRSEADDILIIKNGLVTDSYYCNVALLCKGSWYTPLTPLLYGTKRAQLIRSGLIFQKLISQKDLSRYSHICLFNALIEFGEITIPLSRVFE